MCNWPQAKIEVIGLTFVATSFSSELHCCASTWHQPGWVHGYMQTYLQTFQSRPQLKYDTDDGVHY